APPPAHRARWPHCGRRSAATRRRPAAARPARPRSASPPRPAAAPASSRPRLRSAPGSSTPCRSAAGAPQPGGDAGGGRWQAGWEDQAAGRNGAHQVVELTLDGGQVLEDIRVVELQIVQDGRARAVVAELGPLVEEGAVVLVRLDDEERRIAQPRGNAEVLRN